MKQFPTRDGYITPENTTLEFQKEGDGYSDYVNARKVNRNDYISDTRNMSYARARTVLENWGWKFAKQEITIPPHRVYSDWPNFFVYFDGDTENVDEWSDNQRIDILYCKHFWRRKKWKIRDRDTMVRRIVWCRR